jgi:metallo-beta-lactamase class B
MKTAKSAFRVALFTILASAASLVAQPDPAWLTPFPAFHIAGNLYYVGSEDLGSYLISTPSGLILINSDFASNLLAST